MQPTTITIDLDLESYLRRHQGFEIIRDSSGAPMEPGDEITGPITVEDIVIELAARQIAARLPRDDARGLSERVARIRDDEIRAQIAPLISEVLDTVIQPTNQYGEAKCDAKTLREVVVETAVAELSRTGRDFDQTRGRGQNLVQTIIAKEVDNAFRKELTEAIAAAKAETLAAVKNKAAAVLAGTIVNMAETEVTP